MKLNAAAWTATSTWPGPATGSASSPSARPAMPSKVLQTTARMSACSPHAHGDDLGGGALDLALAHAARDDRFALAVRDDARAQLERSGDRCRPEVAHVQASRDDRERRRAAAEVVPGRAAMRRERRPDRVAIDDRRDRAAVDDARKCDVVGTRLPDADELVAVPAALDAQALRVERAAAEAMHGQPVLQRAAVVEGIERRIGCGAPRCIEDAGVHGCPLQVRVERRGDRGCGISMPTCSRYAR